MFVLRTDTWCFSENSLVKCMWRLAGAALERTWDVCKEYKYSHGTLWHWFILLAFVGLHWKWPLLTTLWHWFALLSSLIFAWPDFIERNAPKNFWWCSGCFLLLWWTRADWQSLSVSSGSSCCCWFTFSALLLDYTADNKDWSCPKELLLNRSTSTLSW